MPQAARIADPYNCGSFIAAGSTDVFINFKPASRLGDPNTGHACFSPSILVAPVASTVFINGIPAGYVGSMTSVHCCGPVCHVGALAVGSPDVYIEG